MGWGGLKVEGDGMGRFDGGGRWDGEGGKVEGDGMERE